MTSTVALALLLALLVPPVWIAAAGGADLDVLGARIDFYRVLGVALALAGALVLAFTTPPAGRGARIARALATIAFAVVAVVAWTGGFRGELLSMRDPARPAWVGLLALAVSLLAARPHLDAARGGRVLVPGLLLGGIALLGVRAADRAELAARLAAAPPHAPGPDVIFLVLDTLRADALGAYGASPSPTPFLDELATRSVVFERALSQAAWTVPSVASFLSSLYPSTVLPEHGRRKTANGELRLPDGLPWLPLQLREAGYHTAGFQKNPLLRNDTEFARGFDVYEYVRGHTAEHTSAAELVDAVVRWGDVFARWRRGGGAGAFFLYAHFMDPHVEYRPPAEFLPPETAGYEGPFDGGVKSLARLAEQPGGPRPEDLAQMRAHYRGEVAYLDTQLRRLHEALGARGLWRDETIVIVLADHGEQFWEHGSFQHEDVYWVNLHVPLLVRAPGFAPSRIPERVRLLDVAPTLLELLGLPPPEIAEGRSLAPLLRGEPYAAEPIVSERAKREPRVRVSGPRLSLVSGPSGTEILTGEMAGETAIAAQGPEVEALHEALARWRERRRVFEPGAPAAPAPLDADTRRRLEALGYAD